MADYYIRYEWKNGNAGAPLAAYELGGLEITAGFEATFTNAKKLSMRDGKIIGEEIDPFKENIFGVKEDKYTISPAYCTRSVDEEAVRQFLQQS